MILVPATLLLSGVGAVVLVSYDRLAAAALTSDARVTKSIAPKLVAGTWVASSLLSLPWILKREYVVSKVIIIFIGLSKSN